MNILLLTMFPSNHIPCSTNPFSPQSFFDHEKTNLHPIFDNPFISSNFATHQQFYNQDQDDLLDSVVSSSIKKKITPSMKDERSKIFTDRGPRERRVRLSIEISRKFFCLQDLLGFDKPSKTLDWLFTQSLTAIKDLVNGTNCSTSTVTDQSRVKFLEAIMKVSGEETGPRKKKMTQRCQDDFLRYQLRLEARSRARERTKEKLRVKRFDDQESWKISHGSSFLIGEYAVDPGVNDLLDLE